MKGNFTNGMIIGSIIGASMSMMMNNNTDMMRTRKKMMKNGRNFLRKSGRVVADVVDMLS